MANLSLVMGMCPVSDRASNCTNSILSAEAAIALRQRLNETVEELDALRREHAELEIKFESQSKELTIAKSDREFNLHMHLVVN